VCRNKCDNYYLPAHEGGIAWNDQDLNIDWKVPMEDIVLSEKDTKNTAFKGFKSEF